MYKVMIVDDEPAIRKGLVNFIPWEELDCQVTSVAIDGIDALEMLKDSKPDIVLTDIKMPGMDGLELAKHIHHNYPTMKTIILTAYSDFAYSQEAIKYGVVDFVLKPTSTVKLVEAMKRAKHIISSEREKTSKIKNLESKLSNHITELQHHFLLNIINKVPRNPLKIVEKMHLLRIKLKYFFAIVIQIDTSDKTLNNKEGIFAVKNLISSLAESLDNYNIVMNNQQLCALLSFDQRNYSLNMQILMKLCNEIVYISKNLNQLNVFIGISNMHRNATEISVAYQEGIQALANKFYVNKNIFIHTMTQDKSFFNSSKPDEYFHSIVKAVRERKYEDALKGLEELLEIQGTLKYPIENTKNLGVMLYYSITSILSDDEPPSNQRENSACIKIWNSRSVEDIHDFLATTIVEVCQRGYCRKNTGSIIDKIDEYINEYYHKKISLLSIARHVHLNDSYLSRLYKEKTDITLTEKITEVRMEKAKEKLLTTDLNISEISLLVGISNASYFSMSFSKYTGMPPKKYRAIYSKVIP